MSGKTNAYEGVGVKEEKNIKLLYELLHPFKIFSYAFLGLGVENG